MLNQGKVATRLPAQDLERARSFYAEKLGLEPVEEREGGLRYVCARCEFALFASAGAASGDHTQMGWEVADLEATVAELRSRGVVFEEYSFPGLKTVDGIATIEGNYPSKGSGELGAWFRDSEGNMLGIGQPIGGRPASKAIVQVATIIVAGALIVDPVDRDAYLSGCEPVVAAARRAPGCLDYALSADLVDADRINVFEHWEDRDSLERFRGSGPDGGQLALLREIRVAEYEVT